MDMNEIADPNSRIVPNDRLSASAPIDTPAPFSGIISCGCPGPDDDHASLVPVPEE